MSYRGTYQSENKQELLSLFISFKVKPDIDLIWLNNDSHVVLGTAAAANIFVFTHLGVPVSITHVITGSISGVGSAIRISAARLGLTLRIVWAWIFTILAAAIIGGLLYLILRLGGIDIKTTAQIRLSK